MKNWNNSFLPIFKKIDIIIDFFLTRMKTTLRALDLWTRNISLKFVRSLKKSKGTQNNEGLLSRDPCLQNNNLEVRSKQWMKQLGRKFYKRLKFCYRISTWPSETALPLRLLKSRQLDKYDVDSRRRLNSLSTISIQSVMDLAYWKFIRKGCP